MGGTTDQVGADLKRKKADLERRKQLAFYLGGGRFI